MRYLRENAALSSLTVELHPIPTTPIVNPEGWQPLEDARASVRGLIDFAQWLGSFLIALVIWTPVWLPIFFLVRYVRRRRAPRRTADPTDVPHRTDASNGITAGRDSGTCNLQVPLFGKNNK
jgi:hypothetical protein